MPSGLAALRLMTSANLVGSCTVRSVGFAPVTLGVRIELRSQRTVVVGVYAGFVDTDMTKNLTVPKVRPEDIAAAVVSGLENGIEEILADERSREVATNFVRESRIREEINQKIWDESPYSKQ